MYARAHTQNVFVVVSGYGFRNVLLKRVFFSPKHTTIIRVTDHSITKRHHFENCNLNKVLYGR